MNQKRLAVAILWKAHIDIAYIKLTLLLQTISFFPEFFSSNDNAQNSLNYFFNNLTLDLWLWEILIAMALMSGINKIRKIYKICLYIEL